MIIEHERPTPAGFVYDWLAERGAEVDELKIDVEDREIDPRDYDLLVPLGSEHPPYADHIPWIPRELEWDTYTKAMSAGNFGRYAFNSLVLALANMVCNVVLSAMVVQALGDAPAPCSST